jgi:hypothetical protein
MEKSKGMKGEKRTETIQRKKTNERNKDKERQVGKSKISTEKRMK